MKPGPTVAAVLIGGSLCWACGRGENAADRTAHAKLINGSGDAVAQARFTETDSGVKINLVVESLPPGSYLAQIHEVGACDPPGFLSAGAPYPPPAELAVVEGVTPPLHRSIAEFRVRDGSAEVEAVAPAVTLLAGANSLFHPGGAALVIDDLSPAGTFEGRAACGIITRASGETVGGVPSGGLESAHHPDAAGTAGKRYQQPASQRASKP
jgi:Cu-Zn family superoxide dismutase